MIVVINFPLWMEFSVDMFVDDPVTDPLLAVEPAFDLALRMVEII